MGAEEMEEAIELRHAQEPTLEDKTIVALVTNAAEDIENVIVNGSNESDAGSSGDHKKEELPEDDTTAVHVSDVTEEKPQEATEQTIVEEKEATAMSVTDIA